MREHMRWLSLERCSRRYVDTKRELKLWMDANVLQAERDPEEEGDFMAFEQLMAEAAAKKENKHDKHDKHHHDKKEKKKEKDKV